MLARSEAAPALPHAGARHLERDVRHLPATRT